MEIFRSQWQLQKRHTFSVLKINILDKVTKKSNKLQVGFFLMLLPQGLYEMNDN